MSTPFSPNTIRVAEVAETIKLALNVAHSHGADGKEVALGAISALRMFVLTNVGAEQWVDEIRELAKELLGGIEDKNQL